MAYGHLFVVQGDLTKIAADDVVVPTDRRLQPGASWKAFGSTEGLKPPDWGNDGTRVSKSRRAQGGPRIRWLNTGTTKELDKQKWLAEGISQALAAVAEDVDRDLARPESKRMNLNDRARHLLAVPLFGTGRGGFHEVRRDVIDMMLERLGEFSDHESIDVVLVCRRRSDYGAVQSRRTDLLHAHCCLDERLLSEARRIGGLASEGSLALFMGAGVGVPAGLPTWDGLIAALAGDKKAYKELRLLSPPDAVAILSDDGRNADFLPRLKKSLSTSRYSIGHAMLASMRVHEAVTTNFDALYESACESSFFKTPLRVMPWERAASVHLGS
jgi:O-acetyl-ADP-ribose deacetylase (regulator of RNase III)